MATTKFALAINADNSLNQQLGNRFAIVTCQDKEITQTTELSLEDSSYVSIAKELKNQQIDALLVKNIDIKAISALDEHNIPAFRIRTETTTIKDTVNDQLKRKLSPIVKMFTCGGACDF